MRCGAFLGLLVACVPACTTIEVQRTAENEYIARIESTLTGTRSFEDMGITRTGDGTFEFSMSGGSSETESVAQTIAEVRRLLREVRAMDRRQRRRPVR